MALVGEAVFDPRGDLGKAGSGHDAGVLEAAQTIREGLRTDAQERALQLAEATATWLKIADDERGPPVADQYRGAGDWAANCFKGCHLQSNRKTVGDAAPWTKTPGVAAANDYDSMFDGERCRTRSDVRALRDGVAS